MDQKKVFVLVIYRFDNLCLPGLHLYDHGLDWIKSMSFHLSDEGALLVEYKDGVRVRMTRIIDHEYVDIVL